MPRRHLVGGIADYADRVHKYLLTEGPPLATKPIVPGRANQERRRPPLPSVWLEARPGFRSGPPAKIIRLRVGAEQVRGFVQDDDRSADRHAVVKVDDVMIEQADASA